MMPSICILSYFFRSRPIEESLAVAGDVAESFAATKNESRARRASDASAAMGVRSWAGDETVAYTRSAA